MLPSRIFKSPTRPTSIRTLFMEQSLPCQLGVLNLDRVLPSRRRTDALFSEGRPSPTPQSPELGGLV